MRTKTTLTIDSELMRRVKERAKRDGMTVSDLVETVLRRGLEGDAAPGKPPPVRLPSYNMGEPLIDITDKQAMYELLDEGLQEKYGIRDAR